MNEVTERDRFESAVKIITGLPKDGSFQPSNELKLKFYAYYKQATVGPCEDSKPGFWDVVRRAKWEAWKSLGNMNKDDAMKGYVNTLKQVVETMSLSSDVQEFLNQIGPMYEFVTPDGKTVTSHEQLPNNENEFEVLSTNAKHRSKVAFSNGGNYKLMNGHHDQSDEDGNDENFNKPASVSNLRTTLEDSSYAQSSVLSLSESHSDDENFSDARDAEINTASQQSVDNLTTLLESTVPRSTLSDTDNDRTSPSRQSKAVQSDEQQPSIDKLPKDRRRAVSQLGRTLRDIPEYNSSEWGKSLLKNRSPEECNDALVRAWEAVSQMRVQNLSRVDSGDDEKYLRRHARPTKAGLRKQRGRGSGGSSNDKDKSEKHQDSDGHSSGSEPSASNDRARDEQPGHSRDGRHSSGTSSDSSKDSAGFDWDPQVGAVLLRMHRELQHISRQLELMEGILITQQQMVRNALVVSSQGNKSFFSNMSWRTVLFVIVWPVVVNFLLRLCWTKIIRKRGLLLFKR